MTAQQEQRVRRPIRVEGDVAYIPLTKGYEAVIDAADMHLVEGFNWCASVALRVDGSIRTVYAVRNARGKPVSVHSTIVAPPAGRVVDHKDGDGLNNRRSNLRVATVAQNTQNQRLRADNSSGFKGVSWHKSTQKWRATIQAFGRMSHVGSFGSAEEAYAAYERASKEAHGAFGRAQ